MNKDVMALANKAMIELGGVGNFDAKKVKAKTASLAARGVKYAADTHAVAVACLHFAAHSSMGGASNGEPARQLVNALHSAKAKRVKTLVDWFHAFSNVRLTFDKKADGYTVKMVTPKDDKLFRDDATIADLLAQAMAKPYWDVEEQTKGPQAFDFAAGMASLVKRAEAAIKADMAGDADMAAKKLAVMSKAMAELKMLGELA